MVSLKRFKINRGRPTIGITGPDKGGGVAWLFTALGVLLAGGKPVRITPANPQTADGIQGLIIGGGADVDPSIYEQEGVIDEYLRRTLKHPRKNLIQRIGRLFSWIYFPALFFVRKLFSRRLVFGLDRARDHLELQLIDQAVKKGLPVIGICRGSQLMNVYFKGTLYQDINTFYTEEPNPASVFPVKKVFIKKNSKLEQVLGVRQLRVNALHNQAVKQPGEGIDIVGQEANKVVQAIENKNQLFMIGVQWHPEYLPQDRLHRRLFQALVQYARLVNHQIEDKDMSEVLAQAQAGILLEMEGEYERLKIKNQSNKQQTK